MMVCLAEKHVGLAYYLAADFCRTRTLPPEVDKRDVKSAALLGLVKAARTFDENAGANFATHAHRRIHGAICDMLRAEVVVGPQIRRTNQHRKYIRVGKFPSMLNEDSTERDVEVRDELNYYWARFQTRLTQQQRAALWLRYSPENDLYLWDIAEVLGVSESRVCQILRQARKTLRGESE